MVKVVCEFQIPALLAANEKLFPPKLITFLRKLLLRARY